MKPGPRIRFEEGRSYFPTPQIWIAVGVAGSSETRLISADFARTEVGVKAAWNVQVLPGARVWPEHRSLLATIENWSASPVVEVIERSVMVRFAMPLVPVFLTVNVATAVRPVFTLPKFL